MDCCFENFNVIIEQANMLELSLFTDLLNKVIYNLKTHKSNDTIHHENIQASKNLDMEQNTVFYLLFSKIVKQALFYKIKPKNFKEFIESLSFDKEKVNIFSNIYTLNSQFLISHFRNTSVSSNFVENLNWQVAININDSNGFERKSIIHPLTYFEISKKSDITNSFILECDSNTLEHLFTHVEKIQKDLDKLK